MTVFHGKAASQQKLLLDVKDSWNDSRTINSYAQKQYNIHQLAKNNCISNSASLQVQIPLHKYLRCSCTYLKVPRANLCQKWSRGTYLNEVHIRSSLRINRQAFLTIHQQRNGSTYFVGFRIQESYLETTQADSDSFLSESVPRIMHRKNEVTHNPKSILLKVPTLKQSHLITEIWHCICVFVSLSRTRTTIA